MVGFNNIIGHEIIRHLKNAMQTERFLIHIYLQEDRVPARNFLQTTYAMTLQYKEGRTEPCQNAGDFAQKGHGEESSTLSWSATKNQV